MQLVQLILPSLATIALGSALLAPHRDDPCAPGTASPSPFVRLRHNLVRLRLAARKKSEDVTKAIASNGIVTAAERDLRDEGEHEHEHERDRDRERERGQSSVAGDVASLFARHVADAALEERPPSDAPESGDLPDKSVAANSIDLTSASDTPGRSALQPPVSASPTWVDSTERVLPLTRLRLRPHGVIVTWPALLEHPREGAGQEERRVLLSALEAEPPDLERERILLRAFHEENDECRLVALRALTRAPSSAAGDAFAAALEGGTDEERAVAIEGLAALGRRDELTRAFTDRVEAIAAKSLLAYVPGRRRADFAAVLDRHVEPSRREAILTLLAGVLE